MCALSSISFFISSNCFIVFNFLSVSLKYNVIYYIVIISFFYSCKYKLDNLCVIVDNNNLQIDGKIEEVKGLTNIGDKFKSFGFEVLQIDGNNIEELLNAFNVAKQIKGRPTVIIAKTIKGKGVSFMENKVEWHGRAPKEEEYKQAIEELSKKYAM